MTLTLSILHPSPRLTTICNIYFWQRRKEKRKVRKIKFRKSSKYQFTKDWFAKLSFSSFLFLLISSSCLTADDHEHWIIVNERKWDYLFITFIHLFPTLHVPHFVKCFCSKCYSHELYCPSKSRAYLGRFAPLLLKWNWNCSLGANNC